MKRRIRAATVALALVVIALAASAGSASAASYDWSCGAIAPNSWCLASQIHTYDDNEAEYAWVREHQPLLQADRPGQQP